MVHTSKYSVVQQGMMPATTCIYGLCTESAFIQLKRLSYSRECSGNVSQSRMDESAIKKHPSSAQPHLKKSSR